MTKLIVLSGVPGSGKTTFAQKLEFFYRQNFPRNLEQAFNIVSSDEIRISITGTRSDLSRDDEVWDKFDSLPTELLHLHKENTITVLDATHVSAAKRLAIAKKYANCYDQFYLVQFQVDRDAVFKTNMGRGLFMPEKVLSGYCDSFEIVTDLEREIFNTILIWKRSYDKKIFNEILKS